MSPEEKFTAFVRTWDISAMGECLLFSVHIFNLCSDLEQNLEQTLTKVPVTRNEAKKILNFFL
jgi:hypothetical protein